jgi:hypothetical protein
MRLLTGHRIILAILIFAACGDAVGPAPGAVLNAEIQGSVEGDYAGTGWFQARPGQIFGPTFSLHSDGVGGSANQGFAFAAHEAPESGEYAVGVPGPGVMHVAYWHDEGQVRRVFAAESGMVEITHASNRRIAGTFQIGASLVYRCEIAPGFPGAIMVCDPADEVAALTITGSFDAAPIGG